MKKKILVLASSLALLSFVGCSSTESVTSPSKYIKTEVINNSDRTLKTPDWVLSSKVLNSENTQLIYTYKMSLDGAARPDACVAMARSQAVAEMLKFIKNAVTASGQVEDLNASSDPSFSSLTAFLSQGNISGAQVSDNYWEQTMEADASGLNAVKKLMCAVKVAIDKQTLLKQMTDAINGTPGGNAEVRQKLIDSQKNFIENAGNSTPIKTTPVAAPAVAPAQ